MSPSALFVTTVPITLEVFLAPFARHFRGLGWRVDALANGASRAAILAESFDGLHDISWTRSPRSLVHLAGLSRRVRQVVGAGGYDLVHVHTPIAAFVTRFALRRLRTRPVIVYTAHGFHFHRGQRPVPHALFGALERTAARWTDFLVTINAEDFEAARAFGTIDPLRVRHIPGIGVDLAPFAEEMSAERRSALRAELRVDDTTFLVLMVAEFSPVKRHRHLVEALAAVRDPGVVVSFVGDGPLEPAVQEYARELGVSNRVRFLGYRRDVPELLAAADALALTSEREGLPRSILEAMAAGKPVIGTDTRGIADLVLPDAGWIASKDDVAALAAALEQAAANPAEAARRGAAGRDAVLRRYSLPLILEAYQELYAEALSSHV